MAKEKDIVARLNLFNVTREFEGSDGIREFTDETELLLDRDASRNAFIALKNEDDYIRENGIQYQSRNNVVSNYNNGFSSISHNEYTVEFTKEQLREFLTTVDKEVLKEVLPIDVVTLDELVSMDIEQVWDETEQEWVEHGEEQWANLTKSEQMELFSHKFEEKLRGLSVKEEILDLDDELIKPNESSKLFSQEGKYEETIKNLYKYLVETGQYYDEPYGSSLFEPIFESTHYIGLYFYDGANDFYLVDKGTGIHSIILGDSPDFIAKNCLEDLVGEKLLDVANEEYMNWLIDYSAWAIEGWDMKEAEKAIQYVRQEFGRYKEATAEFELLTSKPILGCAENEEAKIQKEQNEIFNQLYDNGKNYIVRNYRIDMEGEEPMYILVANEDLDAIASNVGDIKNGMDIGIKDGLITLQQHGQGYSRMINGEEIYDIVKVDMKLAMINDDKYLQLLETTDEMNYQPDIDDYLRKEFDKTIQNGNDKEIINQLRENRDSMSCSLAERITGFNQVRESNDTSLPGRDMNRDLEK